MKALVFDGRLHLDPNRPKPAPQPGWAVIRVCLAGICRTDLEITRGYMAFSGVLGHEFVGAVESCDDRSWIGKRVVGEINAACGQCPWCRRGLGRHCPNRTVLGIAGHAGCMAEYCTLPVVNLHAVPDSLSDDEAVFTEPVSAACEILEQVDIGEDTRCVVMGDGKLGILCAWVLAPVVVNELTVIGSRCGPFGRGLALLETERPPVRRLIAARYPLERAMAGFEHAARRGVFKVLLDIGPPLAR